MARIFSLKGCFNQFGEWCIKKREQNSGLKRIFGCNVSNRQVYFKPKRLREYARTANVQHREKRQSAKNNKKKGQSKADKPKYSQTGTFVPSVGKQIHVGLANVRMKCTGANPLNHSKQTAFKTTCSEIHRKAHVYRQIGKSLRN